MSEDLIVWLRGVLDDIERIALACQHQHWTRDGGSIYGDHPLDEIVDWVYDEAAWEHIALHDPGSVLADIAAKRAIVDAAARWMDPHPGQPCTNEDDPWDSCALHIEAQQRNVNPYVLRLLASAYADRPGYRPEWAPDSSVASA